MSYKKKSKWPKYCTPLCAQLKCSKNAIGKVVRVNGKELVECNFVPGDYCTGIECNYSYCAKRSFRSDGKCGQWVADQTKKRKTVEDHDTAKESYSDIRDLEKKYPHLKKKTFNKLKKYDLDDY